MTPLSLDDRTTCQLCNERRLREVAYPRKDSPSQHGLQWDAIRLCESCGFGIVTPPPLQSALDEFYASGGYWHANGSSAAQLAHERNQSRHRVDRCKPHFGSRGSVADIGAGHGAIAEWLEHFVSSLVERYDFIEPDRANRTYILGRNVSFPLECVDAISNLRGDYSLIFVNHVLEHVADPVEFLGGLRDKLRPNGVIYVETPHLDYLFKNDVFPHTLFFTPRALKLLAAKLGFEVIECSAFGHYPGRPGGVSPSVYRWLGAGMHYAAVLELQHLARTLDEWIWRYHSDPDGIWLSCLLKRNG